MSQSHGVTEKEDAMPETEMGKRSSGTMVTCDCGAEFALDSREEDEHYVWALRWSGERSMLGYCPVKHGMNAAIRQARVSLSGAAVYHGKVV